MPRGVRQPGIMKQQKLPLVLVEALYDFQTNLQKKGWTTDEIVQELDKRLAKLKAEADSLEAQGGTS